MIPPIRVRYAPSPTGQPHVGNIRTALFNWLFARRNGGRFIVRVEDTDQSRLVAGAVEGILASLKWLGVDWDEGPETGGDYGPYFQSQRLQLYQKAALQLVGDDYAYYCYCSTERLDTMRKAQIAEGKPPRYDRHCLNLSSERLRQYRAGGREPVVRFKMPGAQDIFLNDLVRGEVSWDSDTLDDFIIQKSDGFPTYHLASVLDDHHMEISHVLRAEEWLASAPRHLMLYKAFGFEPPLFGHLPMILGPDRAKLSKRHGATSVLEYKQSGYLPEAMINFMVLLGWSLDDKTEILSRETLIQNFSLDRIVKAGAIFNRDKLDWINGVYIRGLELQEMVDRLINFWYDFHPQQMALTNDVRYLKQIAPLIQERLKRLDEAADQIAFFYQEELQYALDDMMQKGVDRLVALSALSNVEAYLRQVPTFNENALETGLRTLLPDQRMSGRQFFGLIRMAVTGSSVSPPLFQTMSVLGKQRCMARILKAIDVLRID